MTASVRTGDFMSMKNMSTRFASGSFTCGGTGWRLRITSTNNAVSDVALTTICGDRRIGEDVLSRIVFAKQVKVPHNDVPDRDVTGMVIDHKRNAIIIIT